MTISANRKTASAFISKHDTKHWLINDTLASSIPQVNEIIQQFNKTSVSPVKVVVKGGGVNAKLQAVMLLLAKYFSTTELNRKKLKTLSSSILKSDSRRKLPKMPGCKGHSATRQKSYR